MLPKNIPVSEKGQLIHALIFITFSPWGKYHVVDPGPVVPHSEVQFPGVHQKLPISIEELRNQLESSHH